MLMFLFFFALWLLFNGRCTADVIGFGVVFSAAVTVFAVKICGWSEARSRRILRLAGQLAVYFGSLFVEIIRANLSVMRVILSPGCREVQPRIFCFDSHLHRGFAQTIQANSITITPGTYTVGIDGSVLTVHALNADFADGTPDSRLNRQLIELEKKSGSLSGHRAEEGKT